MAYFSYPRIPQFAESDAAGIIHFSRLACFVEEAEHAWLISRGIRIDASDADSLQWPRVRFEATYLRPLKPFEAVDVELTPGEVGGQSITWRWVIRRNTSDERVAEGVMKTVCCKREGEGLKPHPLPEELGKALVSD